MSDLFDCYASSYPLSQSAFELGKSFEGVKGVPAFRGLRHSIEESY